MKNIISLFLGLLFIYVLVSFKTDVKPLVYQTKSFITSANCRSCKIKIEDKLAFTKGVVYSDLDVPSKTLTVRWRTKFLDETKIKQIVSNLGYSIDEIKIDDKQASVAPKCCKPNLYCKQ